MTINAPILDRDHLAQYTAGDPTLEAELFSLLNTQIKTCIADLQSASVEKNWRDAAHTLKGAARGVGAMELGEACARAENHFQNADALSAVKMAAERAIGAMAAVRGDAG